MSLPPDQLTALVERYFGRVDAKDIAGTLELFAPDAVFRIETAGLQYTGRDVELRGMFERLFTRYAGVWHGDFQHVVDAPAQRIASQFRVVNTGHDGLVHHKNNCNFFTVRDGLFHRVSVYMTGENSLT